MKKIVMSMVCIFSLRTISNDQQSWQAQYYQLQDMQQLVSTANYSAVYPSAPAMSHNYKACNCALPELFQAVVRSDLTTFKSLLANHLDKKDFEVFTTLYGNGDYTMPFLIFFARHLVKNEWEKREINGCFSGFEPTCNSLERFSWHAFNNVTFDYSVTDSLKRTVFHNLAKELFSPECYQKNAEKILDTLFTLFKNLPQDQQLEILNKQDDEGNSVLHVLVICAINNHKNSAYGKNGVYCRKTALRYFKTVVSLGASCDIKNSQNKTVADLIRANLNKIDQAEKFAVARNTVFCWIVCPFFIFFGDNTLLYHSDATLLQEMLDAISKK